MNTAPGERVFTVLRGTVGVLEGDRPVPLGGPQQRRALAAFLAEPGAVLSPDRLVEAIWPVGTAPDDARKTVIRYISRLRSAIGADHVATRDGGYVLDLGTATYDADQFEALLADARGRSGDDAVTAYGRALALWTGRAFGDEAAEWWLQPVAARLEELRLVAHEERADALIESGRHAEVVADLESLTVEHPLRERFTALLMRALYLNGRQAEALRTYQRYRDHLAEETGLEPSADLTALDHRITLGDPSLAAPSGEAVPGYELGEVIGEGAFGTVYRARQPSVDRDVAVKVVRPELADQAGFVQRFETEAQLVARLEHPHIVPLYDFWRRPGAAYLVFRLLRGGSLADRQAEGPRSLAEVTRLVEEIGGALGAAHALGVVHRDVKPANILFDDYGNSHLADFGIALLDGADTDHPLRSAGSPLYASPEQLRDAGATAASDQYAFAVVVWESLCGRAPFPGSTATEIGRVKLGQALPPLAPDGEGLEGLDAVLARATDPRPDARFPTVGAFVTAWRQAVGRADPARTTGDLGQAVAVRTAGATVADVTVAVPNPYKGLAAFQEADAGELHGRDRLTTALAAEVERQPVVTVVGPSGAGKSSLVHAGLVPRLRGDGHLVVSMVPGDDPVTNLEAALQRVATAADGRRLTTDLATADGLVAVADRVAPSDRLLVLVVDQFEELWTLVADDRRRDRFAELLSSAARAGDGSRSGRLGVVATLRADQYDRPLLHPTLGPVVSGSSFAVTPLTADELADAIVLPARRAGVAFEPGLVSLMVDDVRRRPGALPLLQFALAQLFDRRHGDTITLADYEDLGGIAGALARRAEELFATATADERPAIRRLFTQLVTPGDGDDLRRRATLTELDDVPYQLVDRFRASRLVVTDHDPLTREPTVEVAHEALLREWPRLADWIDADRDLLRMRRALSLAAHDWAAAPGDDGLFRGSRLDGADDVARALVLGPTERAFLAASHDLADRERRAVEARAALQVRQNLRLRRTLAVTGALLVVALLAGLVAVQQRRQSDRNADVARRQAEVATQARILADAERLAPIDRDVSMLLAVEAARRRPDAASAGALATALLTDPSFLRYDGDRSQPRPIGPIGQPADRPAYSPDGRLLAVPESSTGVIRVGDADTGVTQRVLRLPEGLGDVLQAVLWPRADALVVVARDEFLGIDPATGEVVLPATALPGAAASWAVDEAADHLAVLSVPADAPPQVSVFDLGTGTRLSEAPLPCCAVDLRIGPGGIETQLPGVVAWRGDTLVVASGRGTVEEWRPDTGERIRTVGTDLPAPFALRYVDDGATFVLSGAAPDGTPTLMAYDAETGTPTWPRTLPLTGDIVPDPRHDAVLVADVFSSSLIRRVDLATGIVDPGGFDTQDGGVCFAVGPPDGRQLTAGSCGGSALALWSLEGGGAALRHLADDGHGVAGPIFNRDGTFAALSGTGLDDGVVELDLATGAVRPVDLPVGFLPVMNYDYTTFQVGLLTPDGRLARSPGELDRPSTPFTPTEAVPVLRGRFRTSDAVGDWAAIGYPDDRIDVFRSDPDTGEPRLVRQIDYGDGTSNDLMITADQRRLYVGGTAGLRVFDLRDGRLLDQPFAGFRLGFDRDRRMLAVGALDGTLTLRDADTLTRLGPDLRTPAAAALGVTRGGSILTVVGLDGSLQLYDVATHRPLGPEVDIGIGSQNLLPDGRAMLIAGDDILRELSLDPAEWATMACRAAGRNLTEQEWATYLGAPARATCPAWPPPAA